MNLNTEANLGDLNKQHGTEFAPHKKLIDKKLVDEVLSEINQESVEILAPVLPIELTFENLNI